MSATFQIVTTDDQCRIQGDTEFFVFKALGHEMPTHEMPTLESFETDDGYVILRYSHGLRLAIPDSRIRYIAYLDE